ncbi:MULTISPECIES: ABC transporter [unclassified Duganella]|uniref:ABC transporter n=1 Tax=unclassified Duganella TaxID=2636909 RepID=UPI0011C16158|nr:MULTISPECIES: ABC transporter [unclassified Duganella]
MSYQLVLQVRGELLSDFDAMLSLEQALAIELDDIGEVDGHHMGCGEINIFILTVNPEAAFEKSKPSLISHKLLNRVKAGFRLFSEDSYTTIWPMNSVDEFLVA